MRRRHRTSMPFGWFLVVLMSAGAGGGVMTGLYANSMRTADSLPFEDFDYFDATPPAWVRSEAEPNETAAPTGPTLASAESTIISTTLPLENISLFSPVRSYTSRSGSYTVASVTPVSAPAAASAPAEVASTGSVSYTVASVTSTPAPVETAAAPAPQVEAKLETKPETKPAAAMPVRHASSGRPGGVLNDAQIANIKRRLRLTPDQESLWPAVEVALRNISYSKKAQEMRVASAHSAPMAYVDPNSADVQRLKYAALPLIMRLNEDQKQEVRSMAHVMGLDGVASSF
jgi:hypothetical protein